MVSCDWASATVTGPARSAGSLGAGGGIDAAILASSSARVVQGMGV